MVKGIITAITSMALWGLVFVLPLYVPQFSSFEISMGRFIFYGLISLAFCLVRGKGRLSRLPLAHWKLGLVFAMTSSLLYYYLLVVGVRCLGAPFGTALCSLLPVMATIYGNIRHKVFEWRVLTLPLALMIFGLGLMHSHDFFLTHEASALIFSLGVIAILSTEMMWAWYSINNAEFLAQNPDINASDWSSMIGIFCLIGGVLGLGAMLVFAPQNCYFIKASSHEITTFLMISFVNGFFASWLTLMLWNQASRLLPMAFLAQFGVFEVFFGLFYVYLKTVTFPTLLEVVGITCIMLGILVSSRKIATQKQSQLTEA